MGPRGSCRVAVGIGHEGRRVHDNFVEDQSVLLDLGSYFEAFRVRLSRGTKRWISHSEGCRAHPSARSGMLHPWGAKGRRVVSALCKAMKRTCCSPMFRTVRIRSLGVGNWCSCQASHLSALTD